MKPMIKEHVRRVAPMANLVTTQNPTFALHVTYLARVARTKTNLIAWFALQTSHIRCQARAIVLRRAVEVTSRRQPPSLVQLVRNPALTV